MLVCSGTSASSGMEVVRDSGAGNGLPSQFPVMYPVGDGVSQSAAVEDLQTQSINTPQVVISRDSGTDNSLPSQSTVMYPVGDVTDARSSAQSNSETRAAAKRPNDSEDSTPCLYCEILYVELNCRWYQCRVCLRWACKKCARMGRKKYFKCHECK